MKEFGLVDDREMIWMKFTYRASLELAAVGNEVNFLKSNNNFLNEKMFLVIAYNDLIF